MNSYVDLDKIAPEHGTYRPNGSGAGSDHFDHPLPLFPPLPPADPYPIDHLGPVLTRAARAIARKVQVPDAIAAQSVLAVASLAAQAHANVQLPFGQARPLSLFFLTCSASGDRKTSADKEAAWPVRKREEALHEIYSGERQTWAIGVAAWAAEKRKIESDKKLDFDGRKRALFEIGPEPLPPLHPFLVAPDPTIEGLIKAWVNAPAALGIFSAEGGTFIGGHGMSQDNRLRNAAGFSEAWDGLPIKRVRAGDGVTILRGRRLAMHLMVQPEASAQFLADPVLRDQGLLSRVLVAAPESLAGTRRYAEPMPEDDAAIRAYGARILSILETAWPLSPERAQGLEPPHLPMSEAAADLWRAFYDEVEAGCGAGGRYSAVRDLAAKAAEHAGRIAGVLAIIADIKARDVSEDEVMSGLNLVRWYLNEAVRLQRACRTDPALLRAQSLLDWLRSRSAAEVSLRDILRLGPSGTRTKREADTALEVLRSHGWLLDGQVRPRTFRLSTGSVQGESRWPS